MNREIIIWRKFETILNYNREERRRRMTRELKQLPHGSLYIEEHGGRYFFQRYINGKKHGITKDANLIYALARRKFIELVLEDDRYKLRKYLNKYSQAGLEISRIIYTQAQYDWVTATYSKNTYHPEELIHETYAGVKVRSKSERTIGNLLEEMGIPYRYEDQLTIDISDMSDIEGGHSGVDGQVYKNYYPDFTIMLADGSLIYWEHLGLADNSSYRKHTAEKFAAYRTCANIPDERFIMTFENDLKSLDILSKIVAQKVLMLGPL